jgi:hypothetical protein
VEAAGATADAEEEDEEEEEEAVAAAVQVRPRKMRRLSSFASLTPDVDLAGAPLLAPATTPWIVPPTCPASLQDSAAIPAAPLLALLTEKEEAATAAAAGVAHGLLEAAEAAEAAGVAGASAATADVPSAQARAAALLAQVPVASSEVPGLRCIHTDGKKWQCRGIAADGTSRCSKHNQYCGGNAARERERNRSRKRREHARHENLRAVSGPVASGTAAATPVGALTSAASVVGRCQLRYFFDPKCRCRILGLFA